LAHELRKADLDVVQQYGLTVTYDNVVVGQYSVDLLIEQVLLVELKTAKRWRKRTAPNASTISRLPACR
jgi:GxxExxY protein